MKISELAKRSEVTTHALRHYERMGLLKPGRCGSACAPRNRGWQMTTKRALVIRNYY
ncbi:MAG: MerR family DNA-binding transcriptional regulator [Comamonadaceae bacterium]|nr:MerR family DNA-binding transcriptional regulator [Comamonadaceae bacterium]